MQQVSEAYRKEQRQPIMGAVQAQVELHVVDVDAAENALPDENRQAYWSDASAALTDQGAKRQSYATFEPGRWVADGKLQILDTPEGALFSEGYVSESISDAAGNFGTIPVLVIRLKKPASVPALTFRFDSMADEWCSKLTVTAWRQEKQLMRKTVQPKGVEYELTQTIERFDQLEICFERTNKPFRRARLTRLLFGMQLVFDGKNLMEITHTMETDPIDRRLPIGQFEFSAVNINQLTNNEEGMYDPDNPDGIWKYFEQRNPISVQYAQQIRTRNGWEWLPGGRFYLTGQPKTDGLYAKFLATDTIGILDKTYYKGIWDAKPHSFWELATAVLEDAKIPRQHKETEPWTLWEGLKTITTMAPLPIKKHRECLQLIAHASGCVLATDREGRVSMQPEINAQSEMRLGLFDMLEQAPRVEKNASLLRVDCPVTLYTPQENQTQLHKGSYSIEKRTAIHLRWNAAADITVQCTGAVVTEKSIYAAAGDFVLEGNGTAELLIMGKKLEASTQNITAFAPQLDDNGVVEILENPLITDGDRALKTACWVRDYLLRRSTYTCETRGNIEVDPLDKILIDTQWAKDVPAQVIKNKLSYSAGSLKGELILKKQKEWPVLLNG